MLENLIADDLTIPRTEELGDVSEILSTINSVNYLKLHINKKKNNDD